MQITQFNPNKDDTSPLKASMMVNIPEWDFTLEVKYFQKRDGSSWFGYPTNGWTNAQGEKKYKWLAFFGPKGKEKFEQVLKPLVDEKLDVIPF